MPRNRYGNYANPRSSFTTTWEFGLDEVWESLKSELLSRDPALFPEPDSAIKPGAPTLNNAKQPEDPTSFYKVLKTFARLGSNSEESPGTGSIRSLGKFIVEAECEKAVASVIENGGSDRTRIWTEKDAISLRERLLAIENLPGVAGYVVVGYDGIKLLNTLPDTMDSDAFTAWGLLTFMQAQEFAEAIGHRRMRQMVHKIGSGCMLLCDFGRGLLVVVSDNATTEAIIPLIVKARKVNAA